MQNNTLFDLVQRIKDLLVSGRIDIVYNVAKKPELNNKLRETFTKLADFVTEKNNKIQELANVNIFYRECINKILDIEQLNEDALRNQYGHISKETIDNILRLKEFISTLLQQINQKGEQQKIDLSQLQERTLAWQKQMYVLQQQVAQLQVKNQAKEEKILVAQQEKEKIIKNYQEMIQIMVKQNEELSQFVKKENLQKENLIQEVKKIKIQSQNLQGELQVRKQMVKRLTQQNISLKQQGGNQSDLQKKNKQLQEKVNLLQVKSNAYDQSQRNLQNIKQELQLKSNLIKQLREELNSKSRQLEISVSEYAKSYERANQFMQSDQKLKSSIRMGLNSTIYSSGTPQSSIFQMVNNQYQIVDPLIALVQKINRKKINEVQRLYNFKNQRKHNFHTFIDNKDNILLVGSTQDGKLIGAFTSASISLNDESKDTKAFLFTIEKQNINYSVLKKGKQSVQYDLDFLIFGNEEICLERGKCQITSTLLTLDPSQRHYDNSTKQEYLLNLFEPQGKLSLRNYQIFQLSFEQ